MSSAYVALTLICILCVQCTDEPDQQVESDQVEDDCYKFLSPVNGKLEELQDQHKLNWSQHKQSLTGNQINRLVEADLAPGRINFLFNQYGSLKSLSGWNLQISTGIEQDPQQQSPEYYSRKFLAEYGILFGLSDQQNQLVLQRVIERQRGGWKVVFAETLHGLKVFGDQLTVLLGEDYTINGVGGMTLPECAFRMPQQDTILSADSITTVLRKQVAADDDKDIVDQELGIVDYNAMNISYKPPELGWKITVQETHSTNFYYYSALTGQLIYQGNSWIH